MCARPANPELRQKILAAAVSIIEGCGSDCVTMREVAEKIGYSATTLYLYFKDKNDILKAVVMEGFEELGEALSIAGVGPTPIDVFRQRARAYVVWGISHPGVYQLMFATPEDFRWTPEEAVQATRGWADALEVVGECVESGQIRPLEDMAGFGAMVWAALHGATSLAISRRLFGENVNPSAVEVASGATATADALVNAVLSSVACD